MRKNLHQLPEKRILNILRSSQFIGVHAKIIEHYYTVSLKEVLLKDPRANQAAKRIFDESKIIQNSLKRVVRETESDSLEYETAPAISRLTEMFITCPPGKIEEICDSIEGSTPQSTREYVVEFLESVLNKARTSNSDAIKMVADKLAEIKN